MPHSSYGQELFEPNYSVRAMGMGNAYTSVVKNGDALYYNPAALCRVDGINLTIMDLRGSVNGLDAATKVSKVQNASSPSDYTPLFGTDLGIDAGGKSAIFTPCFAAAAFGSGFTNLKLDNPAYPVLDVSYIADYGLIGGFGFTLVPGLWFGMSVKQITRQGGNIPFGPGFITNPDSSAVLEQFGNRGNGFGADMGLTLKIPALISPVISFSWKNAGYIGFTHAGGAQAPPIQRDEMIFGAALDIDLAVISITPSVDIKHVNRNDIHFGKKLHLGAEIGLPLVDVRGGFHQGYWSVGAGLDLFVMRFDVATWGVEKGVYPGQKEDRRFAAQLTLELGFDPNFNFSGFGGGNRRNLKQRR